MRLLTLIRHAQFDHAGGGHGDKERLLDEAGRREVTEMGQRLQQVGFEPDLVLTSSVARAVETARALVRELGLSESLIERHDVLHHASIQEMVESVRRIDSTRHREVAMVGHHPGITAFAGFLTDGRVKAIPYCGVIRMELEIDRWSEIRRGRALHYYLDVPESS